MFVGGGGGGAPSSVFVRHVVLSLFEGEGGGWSFVFVGAPSIVVGGWLHFLGSRGGGAVIGGHWRSWAITRVVVVKSVVSDGDEHGWWWWEEEMVVVGRK